MNRSNDGHQSRRLPDSGNPQSCEEYCVAEENDFVVKTPQQYGRRSPFVIPRSHSFVVSSQIVMVVVLAGYFDPVCFVVAVPVGSRGIAVVVELLLKSSKI
jgi:hypothetical protein